MGDLDWLKNLIEKKKQMEEEAASTPKYEGPMPTRTPGDLSKSWEEGPTKEKFANLGDFMYSLVRGALGLDASEKVYEAWKEGNPEKMVPGVVDMGLSVPELPEKLVAGVANKGLVAFNNLFKDVGPVLGMFAGAKAKNFGRAKKAGETFLGRYDKMPRFEIDDSKAFFTNAVPAVLPENSHIMLYGMLRHPELFEQYPFLKKIKIMRGEGSYDEAKNLIKIPSTDEYGKTVLVHEIQHAIQAKEGFARGGTTAEFDTLMPSMKESKIGAEIGEVTHPGEWKKIFGTDNPLSVAMGAKDLQNQGLLKKWEINKLREVAREHGFGSFDEMLGYLKKLDDYRSPEGQYQRMAGEIEARDAAARMNLSAKERKKIPPHSSENISPEDAIVLQRGKPGASISLDSLFK